MTTSVLYPSVLRGAAPEDQRCGKQSKRKGKKTNQEYESWTCARGQKPHRRLIIGTLRLQRKSLLRSRRSPHNGQKITLERAVCCNISAARLEYTAEDAGARGLCRTHTEQQHIRSPSNCRNLLAHFYRIMASASAAHQLFTLGHMFQS